MRYLVFCFFLGGIISCTSPKEKEVAEIKSSLDQVNKSFAENHLDTSSVKKAEKAIGQFVASYPKDSLSSKYLFELGMLYQKQRRFGEAVSTFDKVYADYPDSKQAGNAVFLQGFLYANVLNQLDKAKEKYLLYLDKYSNVDPKMTNDVQLELQNLGKSPDELLDEIRAKADTGKSL